MIDHTVMWNFMAFANGRPKHENIAFIKTLLAALPDEISEIQSLSVGGNQATHEEAYDLVLHSQFATWEDLKKYQDHPAHLRVRDEIRKVRLNRCFVDSEC